MKKLLLAFAFLATFTGFAEAQCNGVFPNNTVCGNVTGSGNLPRPTSPSSFLGAAGGSNGQIQYNSGGALAGATGGDVQMSGTTTLIQPSAVTNSKIATGTAGTIKGSTNGSGTSDVLASSIVNTACGVTPSTCATLFGYYNPVWYGALCDGATDDTTAIASAVSAADGATLRFPQNVTCKGRLIICSASPCTNYAITAGKVPKLINLNGATIQAVNNSAPVLYVELANTAKAFAIRDGIFDGANLAPYGIRVQGCNFCVFDNLAEGRAAVGCSFEGTVGRGFYYNQVSNTNCGGSYAAGFSLSQASFTASVTGTVMTVTGAVTGGPIAVGMGVGGRTAFTTGTRITSFGTGTGGAGTYNLNISQTVASGATIAQNLANTGNGIQEYTMNGGSAGCVAGTAYNASNTFTNVTTQFNLARGWDVNCAHNAHVGAESELNMGPGVAFTGLYITSDWFGGYTEGNSNSLAGGGVSPDISFFNTDNSPGIKIFGGIHNGTFNSVTAANLDIVYVSGVTGFGFTANCNGSGRSCVTVP